MLCALLVAGLESAIQAQQYDPALFAEMRWRQIGPFRGGRTVAAVGVPGRPAVLYIGVNNGGGGRSPDYRRTRAPPVAHPPTRPLRAVPLPPSGPRPHH